MCEPVLRREGWRFSAPRSFVDRRSAGLVCCVLACWTSTAFAVVDCGGPAIAVNSNAATDDPDPPFDTDEGATGVIVDASGAILAGWSSIDDMGGTAPPFSRNAFVSRSDDGGQSWTAGVAVNSGGTSAASFVGVANLDGVTLVVWEETARYGFRRSADGGLTWSTTTYVNYDDMLDPDLSMGGNGLAVVVGAVEDPLLGGGGSSSADLEVAALYSADYGASWSGPVVVNDDAFLDSSFDGWPELAIDSDGVAVVAWSSAAGMRAASSTDGGATWSASRTIPGIAAGEGGLLDLAVDGAGLWVALFRRGLTFGISRSQDDGATWSPVEYWEGADGIWGARLSVDREGRWYVLLNSSMTPGADSDLAVSRSVDGARTFTSAALLQQQMYPDGDIVRDRFRMVHGQDGSWVVLWDSDATLGGTIGRDRDILSLAGRDDCPIMPASGCRQPVSSRASRLTIRDRLVGGKGDLLRWTWGRGEATTPPDLGDPTATTDYVFCLYEGAAGVDRLTWELDIPAGKTCGGPPCWSPSGAGYRYKDSSREQGFVRGLSLVAGDDGAARLDLRGGGLGLAPPRLPLSQTPRVLAQLLNVENGECWEATFSEATSSTAEKFSAVSD